jgi:hypothetical protein
MSGLIIAVAATVLEATLLLLAGRRAIWPRVAIALSGASMVSALMLLRQVPYAERLTTSFLLEFWSVVVVFVLDATPLSWSLRSLTHTRRDPVE